MQPVQFPHPVQRVHLYWRDDAPAVTRNLTDLMASLDMKITHMVVLFTDGTKPLTMRESDGLKWLVRLLGGQLELFLQ